MSGQALCDVCGEIRTIWAKWVVDRRTRSMGGVVALFPGIHPAIIFAIAAASSVVIFFAVRLLPHTFYVTAADGWPLLRRPAEEKCAMQHRKLSPRYLRL